MQIHLVKPLSPLSMRSQGSPNPGVNTDLARKAAQFRLLLRYAFLSGIMDFKILVLAI
jgi:hypothetical protein